MKKLLLSLLCILCVITLTGCNKENVKLDMNKISSELDVLTTNEIDIHGIYVEEMDVFDELEGIYEYEFLTYFGLDKDLISDYNVNYNEKKKQILAIFKPIDGKKDEVKEQLEDFMDDIDAEVKEMDDLLVYVKSKDNDSVFETVKNSKTPVFGMMMEVEKSQVKDVLNIEESDVEEFLMKMPMMVVQSNTYIIVKPASGKEDSVKKAIDEYMTNLETQWQNYLPDQYELVKNRKVEKIGEYLVYIVSSNNDLAYNTILNNKIAE